MQERKGKEGNSRNCNQDGMLKNKNTTVSCSKGEKLITL